MPTFEYQGGDARDYFPTDIGHVEVGDRRDFDEAPDGLWQPVKASDKPAPRAPVAAETSDDTATAE